MIAGCIMPQDIQAESAPLASQRPVPIIDRSLLNPAETIVKVELDQAVQNCSGQAFEIGSLVATDVTANLEARWWIDYDGTGTPYRVTIFPEKPPSVTRRGSQLPASAVSKQVFAGKPGAHVIEVLVAYEDLWDPKDGLQRRLIAGHAGEFTSYKWVVDFDPSKCP